MNPIKISLFILVVWVILGIAYAFNLSEDFFEGIMYTFYLAPVAGMLALLISLIFFRSWTKRNGAIWILYLILLIAWAGGVLSYVLSL